MKTKLLLMVAISAVALSATAQKPDSARVEAHYQFTHLRDTTDKAHPYTENMVLMIGQNASVYKSLDRKRQQEEMRKKIAEQVKSGSGNFNVNTGGKSTTGTEYYQFPNENKLVRKENLFNNYLIEEPIPPINWKISGDTATIGNLHCQKATTHFKGRDYIVWFCPDLPFRTGPWKLNGLPGLIVDAHDTKKEVIFKFDGIEEIVKSTAPPVQDMIPQTPGRTIIMVGGDNSNQDPNIIALPASGIKTTEKEFKNLQEAMRKDPDAFMQSALAASGINMRPGGPGGPGTVTKMKINPAKEVINNPIELPEK